jgi:quinol monooxygenase YgiN
MHAPEASMELVIIARFHSREGSEEAVASALREQVLKVRGEPGCREIAAYASTRDSRLFFIHSRWIDEAAFNVHAELANTVQFVERMERLIDHPFDVSRVRAIT